MQGNARLRFRSRGTREHLLKVRKVNTAPKKLWPRPSSGRESKGKGSCIREKKSWTPCGKELNSPNILGKTVQANKQRESESYTRPKKRRI